MWGGSQDGEWIDLAFNKHKADQRKTWVLNCDENSFVSEATTALTYDQFVNHELILYSYGANVRVRCLTRKLTLTNLVSRCTLWRCTCRQLHYFHKKKRKRKKNSEWMKMKTVASFTSYALRVFPL